MAKVNAHKVGQVFAGFTALSRLTWSALVAAGAGQPIVDLLFRLNFLGQPPQVQPFDIGTAISLIAIYSSLSYLSGRVMAKMWNRLQEKDASA